MTEKQHIDIGNKMAQDIQARTYAEQLENIIV